MLLSLPSYSGATSEASRDFHITTTGGWLVSTRGEEAGFVLLSNEENVDENRKGIDDENPVLPMVAPLQKLFVTSTSPHHQWLAS
jgi:hypothetical protein